MLGEAVGMKLYRIKQNRCREKGAPERKTIRKLHRVRGEKINVVVRLIELKIQFSRSSSFVDFLVKDEVNDDLREKSRGEYFWLKVTKQQRYRPTAIFLSPSSIEENEGRYRS